MKTIFNAKCLLFWGPLDTYEAVQGNIFLMKEKNLIFCQIWQILPLCAGIAKNKLNRLDMLLKQSKADGKLIFC